jgi:hypothetical protein
MKERVMSIEIDDDLVRKQREAVLEEKAHTATRIAHNALRAAGIDVSNYGHSIAVATLASEIIRQLRQP